MTGRFRWLTALAATLVAQGGEALQESGSTGYLRVTSGKASFHAVVANLRSEKINPITVHASKCVSPRTLLDKDRDIAAITGTFFAPSTQKSVAEVLVDGELVSKGRRGSVVAVDWYGKVSIFDMSRNQHVDWARYRYGVAGAVRVIRSSVVSPDPKSQHFRDPRIWGRAARTGVGLTRSGKVCLIATQSQVTLSELGRAMRKIGIVDGVSLDGGSSTCLYYQGNYLIAPKRKLNNLFVLQALP